MIKHKLDADYVVQEAYITRRKSGSVVVTFPENFPPDHGFILFPNWSISVIDNAYGISIKLTEYKGMNPRKTILILADRVVLEREVD